MQSEKGAKSLGRYAVSRRAILRGSAAAAAAASLPLGWTTPAHAAVSVSKVRNLVGNPGPTVGGIVATDLGIPVRVPGSSSKTLYIFGDSFTNAQMTQGWRSPVAMFSTTPNWLLNQGVFLNEAVGATSTQPAKQIFNYTRSSFVFTTLPTDIIDINGTLYIFAAVLSSARRESVEMTGIWSSTDKGYTWNATSAMFPGNKDGGNFQMVTWAPRNKPNVQDDYIYLYTTAFNRKKALHMHRVKKANILNINAYEPWGAINNQWNWGNPATDIMPGKFGELCLRLIGDKYLFTWLDHPSPAEANIKALVLNEPWDNLFLAKPVTLISNTSWQTQPQTGNLVSAPYGGYIIPGSSLSNFHMVVSQWNIDDNSVYRTMQFRVSGLV